MPATTSTTVCAVATLDRRARSLRRLDHLADRALAHVLAERLVAERRTSARAPGWRAVHWTTSISDHVCAS